MTTLNLSGQNLERQDIQPKIVKLRNLMNQRKAIWQRLSEENPEKQKKWVTSGKDPIMTLAWDVYKYLGDNFFGDTKDD